MASATTYKIKAGSSFKGVSLDSMTNFTPAMQSQTTDLATDGSTSVRKTLVDSKKMIVTVTGTNQHIVDNANMKAGKYGSLVLNTVLRSDGDSNGDAVTMTFEEAVLTDYQADIPELGAGSISITFHVACKDDDNTHVVYS